MSTEIIANILVPIVTKIPLAPTVVNIFTYSSIKETTAGFEIKPRNDILQTSELPTYGVVYQPVTTETGDAGVVARRIKQISVPYSGESGAEIAWPTGGVNSNVPHHFKVQMRQDAHGTNVYDIFYEEIATGTSVNPTIQIKTIVSDGDADSIVLPDIDTGDLLLGTDLVFRGNRGSKVIYDYFALYVKESG